MSGKDWDILKPGNSKVKSVTRDPRNFMTKEIYKTDTCVTPISKSPRDGPLLNSKNLDALNHINRSALSKEMSILTVQTILQKELAKGK